MKTQISGDAIDLKVTYILYSSLSILVGSILILSIVFGSFFSRSAFIVLPLCFIVLGIIGIVLSNRFVPYCHKIEVDENSIYISKSQPIIMTEIEETITIPKNYLLNIKSTPLGIKIAFWKNDLFYLELKEKTKFGDKIAFISKMKKSTDRRFEEFDLLKS